MTYRLTIYRGAQKELENLPINIYQKVKERIFSLSTEPMPIGCLKLSGRDGWRIRIADYRIVYEIDDKNKIVTIINIGHRRDVYK